MEITHAFDHLSKGPYKYLGLGINDPTAIGGAFDGASCSHCGTPIVYKFYLEGVDKIRFVVGSVCINKALLESQSDLVAMVLGDRKKAEKLKKSQQLENDWAKARIAIAENRDQLRSALHPKGFQNSNLENYLAWFSKNAGKAKFTATAKRELKAIGLWD